MPDHIAAATRGTSSRPMAIANWRWSERDQKERISPEPLSAEYGVCHTCLRKARCTKCAAVTASARRAVRIRIVTTVGQTVVQSKLESSAYDLGFGQHLQRRMHAKCTSLHTFGRRERRQLFKCRDVLGPAVRVA